MMKMHFSEKIYIWIDYQVMLKYIYKTSTGQKFLLPYKYSKTIMAK